MAPPSTEAAHAVQDLLEGLVFLLPGQNLQALDQRQAGVNHHRELAREDGQLLLIHAGSESGDVELLPLFGELADVDLARAAAVASSSALLSAVAFARRRSCPRD